MKEKTVANYKYEKSIFWKAMSTNFALNAF